MLQALVAERSRDRALAHDRLARALEGAASEDYVRAFLDEGDAVARLLPGVRSVAPAFTDRLLEAFHSGGADLASQGRRVPVPPDGPESGRKVVEPLIEPLSERELEVLQLVAAGLSNREIAQELYIAVGTVKRHTNHIYGKLGVHSRTQAVARSRELGLL